jgi:hypothetical protein
MVADPALLEAFVDWCGREINRAINEFNALLKEFPYV